MKKIIVGYSRQDKLGVEFTEDYKFKVRMLIDNVAEAVERIEDNWIKTMYVTIESTEWIADEEIKPVYAITINDHFLYSFKIEEFLKINDIEKIAYRLNKIVENKYKSLQSID